MSFSANEKFNGLFEISPRSPFGVWKQITHHFYWESNPLTRAPQVFVLVLMSYGGSELPTIEIASLLSEEMRDEKKKKAGNVDIVWKWCDWIPTWQTHHKSPRWGKQTPQLTNGWACGGGGVLVWGQTSPFCIEKWTHRDHVWIQPMSATESLVPFLLFWFCDYSI